YAAEPAWLWCKNGLVGGVAKKGDFTFDIGYDKKNDVFGLLDLRGTAQLTDGDIDYLEGMPPVHKVYGTAHFTPRNILIDIDKGYSDGISITGGKVDIYDLNKEDNFILIDLVGNSTVEDALKLIDNPPLEFTSSMGVKPEDFDGKVDLKLKLNFELRQDLEGKDIKVDVDADLHNIKITDLLPEHTIASDNIKLKVNSAGWSLNGEGKFDGIPLSLKMNEKFADKNYKSKLNIAFKLDDKAKKILGIDWSILDEPNVSGYALVNADVVVKQNDLINISLKADLQHAKMDYAYLGLVKENGKPADLNAHLTLKKDKIQAIDNMTFHTADYDITGRVDMYPSGRVKLVDIRQISAPKTSARAKISLTDAERAFVKVDVSGSSFDLTALFDKDDDKDKKDAPKQVEQKNEDDGLEKVNSIDVFISVNSLWTNKSTPIKNFAGNAKLRYGIGIDEVHLVGNYGIDKSIKLNVDYTPRGKKEHYLSIDSNNAGSTLKVLHLYDNMVGGTLKLEARRDAGKKFIGHATVRDFSIRNAPVMAQLLSVASLTGMLDLLRGDGLTFTHLSAPFEYERKILQLNQVKAEGSVVGLTAKGTYNRATDVLNLKGVIAPAYSLNRLLGKIPVVGDLLASKDGTIFAADYKINGSVEKPDVDINALSILSPNSMKEWYNANFGDDDEN
ncbi:MAG: AsmA-like C-terminal domain-containing protein, partial [Alphaproteobacteria bacterium]|nr:AsmA-like C-terminal domain-containing protein [Alphaproteobacteria bacterium]